MIVSLLVNVLNLLVLILILYAAVRTAKWIVSKGDTVIPGDEMNTLLVLLASTAGLLAFLGPQPFTEEATRLFVAACVVVVAGAWMYGEED